MFQITGLWAFFSGGRLEDLDIAVWLATVHLEQYADTFRRHGLATAGAARGLGHEELRQLGVNATGHRKRILRLLQAGSAEGSLDPKSDSTMEPSPSLDAPAQTPKPVPKPRTVFGGLTGPATTQRPGPSPTFRGPEVSRSPESSPKSPPLPTSSSGQPSSSDMVEMMPNAIYFGLDLRGGAQAAQDMAPDSSQKAAPTPALRPATGTVHIMDPGCLYYGVQPVGAPGATDRREGRGVCQDRAEHRLSRQDLEAREDAGYASLELPGDSTLSLPTLDTEETSDDLISPYASFSSTADPPTPLLSGWLDKLSPQGNYVFQRRFVRFNGRSLMYFGSDKDPFPKGVIPLTAIEMTRSSKDNKFQIITGQRVFVFRTESEAQRDTWCSTLQSCLKELHLLGSPRPPQLPRPLRTGMLELRGHKAKVFAALSPGELALYKSEQAFSLGIGICFIELQGCSVRETKSRGFDLLTPHRCFRWGPDWGRQGWRTLGGGPGCRAQEASVVGWWWRCTDRSPVSKT